MIAARVSEAGQVEHRLHAPVLTCATVQRQEHEVDVTDINGSRGQSDGTLSHGGDFAGRRGIRRDASTEQSPFVGSRQSPRCGIDRVDLVAATAQGGDHLRGACDRDVALLACTAEQDGNLHRSSIVARQIAPTAARSSANSPLGTTLPPDSRER